MHLGQRRRGSGSAAANPAGVPAGKWAQLEAVVGSDSRIKLIAKDFVEHFENRLSAMDGKAMIVVMSRRIAVALYREIVALRPEWHADDDEKGALKIVMTGSPKARSAQR